MRKSLMALALAAAMPLAFLASPVPAEARPGQDRADARRDYQRDLRDARRDYRRDLRRADSRRDVYQARRGYQRDLREARRDYYRDMRRDRYRYDRNARYRPSYRYGW